MRKVILTHQQLYYNTQDMQYLIQFSMCTFGKSFFKNFAMIITLKVTEQVIFPLVVFLGHMSRSHGEVTDELCRLPKHGHLTHMHIQGDASFLPAVYL